MVFFSCNLCGESLKKNRVEKHKFSCRSFSAVSCVDCGKDFCGATYVEHIKCISEEEKYGGADFVAKEKKGDVKQSSWVEEIQEVIKTVPADSGISDILNSIAEYPNVPRKEKKFVNFVSNSLNVRNKALISKVWEVLLAQIFKKKADASPQKAQDDGSQVGDCAAPSDPQQPDGDVEVGDVCPGETIDQNQNTSDTKTKKKKKKKNKKIEDDHDEEIHVDSGKDVEKEVSEGKELEAEQHDVTQAKEEIEKEDEKSVEKVGKKEKKKKKKETKGQVEENSLTECEVNVDSAVKVDTPQTNGVVDGEIRPDGGPPEAELESRKKRKKEKKKNKKKGELGVNGSSMEAVLPCGGQLEAEAESVSKVGEGKQEGGDTSLTGTMNGQLPENGMDVTVEEMEVGEQKGKKRKKSKKEMNGSVNVKSEEGSDAQGVEEPAAAVREKKLKTGMEDADAAVPDGETKPADTPTGKFKWSKVITRILTASRGQELRVKKLRKKVVAEFVRGSGGGGVCADDLPALFEKKLGKMEGVVIENKMVKLKQ